MRSRRGLALLLMAALAPSGALELARSSVSGGRSLEYASALTALGPRLTGTAAYQRAADWSAEPVPRDRAHARRAGAVYDRARMGARVGARADRGAGARDLQVAVARLDAVDAGRRTRGGGGGAAGFRRSRASSLQGRIVLLPEGDPPGDSVAAANARHAFDAALRAAGVARDPLAGLAIPATS